MFMMPILVVGLVCIGPHHYGIAENMQNSVIQQLDSIVQQSPILDGAIAGISIRDANSGTHLYNHNGNVRLQPASNLKLVTAMTALSVLGVDYTFQTEVLTDGVLKDGLLLGNVYLRGKGDPTLLLEDLEQLSKKLRESGITAIKGDVIADDTWFDDVRYSIDLPWSDEETYYGGQVSALNLSPDRDYDAGTVIVEVRPSKIGQSPRVSTYPNTDYVRIVNKAKTVDEKGVKDLTITREHGQNLILIEGTIPVHSTLQKDWVATWDPSGYTAQVFKETLHSSGIKVLGKVRSGITPDNAKEIAIDTSIPLAEIVMTFMKQSNNGIGEVLVKEVGKKVHNEGSWDSGLQVVNIELKRLGINTDNLIIRDGSGISHVNSMKANDFTSILFSLQREKWFSTYYDSLPIAGSGERIIGGTLFHRMHNLPDGVEVRAKTGTLSTVSTLSGYITTKSGKKLIFSIMLNHLLDEGKGKELEDEIVHIIANQ
ncbi:D-alanyl-D-alanine carboxypeptidase/D-alanyl-D-alanine endopeptidase [Bacillus suaedaesalsae]|uniref:D-alanyl-D-alanine carboxypeptidase/D-alanyl-D-alanine-endopeptidase n=1 Tax=Bacillus suaedaesalsae TaxID=2810349 RepID=A0ABS2DLX8_9BACI|nr:D-alanyl-D-alanine carboxypeptidase/D-alanyl-D-alanine-endopeptidase [Bacillus suaedaesalsae]MBM6619494.1 D-alanyl-D-alanine carboxypeptidase/D-alanyl-D-alanine-endopeptidase [Bacillus suaedaesalsae]